jgi:hypothetical protein
MNNPPPNRVGGALSGQALTNAMRNFAAVRQLVAAGQPMQYVMVEMRAIH